MYEDSLMLIHVYKSFNLISRLDFVKIISQLVNDINKNQISLNIHDNQKKWLVRTLCLDALTKVMMTVEDLGAFCLGFEGDFNDLPKKVIGYSTKDIDNFYNNIDNKNLDYFEKLWNYSDPSEFNTIQEDSELIKRVQEKNARELKSLLLLAKEFRNKNSHNKTYNKYKHGFPLIMGFELSNGELPDGFDIIGTLSNKEKPFENISYTLIGEIPLDRYRKLQETIIFMLYDLMERRRLQIEFEGVNFPPHQIWGESIFSKDEVDKYHKIVNNSLPEKRKLYNIEIDTKPVNMSDELKWFLSNTWETEQ